MKCFEFITLSFISLNLLSFSVENLDDYLEVAKVNEYQNYIQIVLLVKKGLSADQMIN